MKTEEKDFLLLAETAAREAGQFLLKYLGTLQAEDINQKGPFDFVTHIDHQAEKILADRIRAVFPQHKIFAEEDNKQAAGGFRWIIDPLDGTTNYVHGHPVFSISMALEYEGELILGVVYDPTRDELFAAQKGCGATLNGKRIGVSRISRPEMALLATGFPFRKKHLLPAYLQCFQHLFTQVSGIRRMGSAALDLCYVACGRVDGFWEIGLSPWDVAAGAVILKEAGGVITDFGEDKAVWSGNVIASNGLIHDILKQSVTMHLLPAMRQKRNETA